MAESNVKIINMWKLIVLLLALGYGAMLGCTNPMVDLPACAFRLFDTNHDGQITEEEVTTRLETPLVGVIHPEALNASRIITACDTNNDTVFTQSDWDDDPCLSSDNTDMQKFFCVLCYRNQ